MLASHDRTFALNLNQGLVQNCFRELNIDIWVWQPCPNFIKRCRRLLNRHTFSINAKRFPCFFGGSAIAASVNARSKCSSFSKTTNLVNKILSYKFHIHEHLPSTKLRMVLDYARHGKGGVSSSIMLSLERLYKLVQRYQPPHLLLCYLFFLQVQYLGNCGSVTQL